MTYVANASALIGLQRRRRLATYAGGRKLYITERVRMELVEKPRRLLQDVRTPRLREALRRSIEEFETMLAAGDLVVASIHYAGHGRLIERARREIAVLEQLPMHEVKADHTTIALALQTARRGRRAILLSNDQAINTVAVKLVREQGLRLAVETIRD